VSASTLCMAQIAAAFKGLAIAPTSERSLNSWVTGRLTDARLDYEAEVPLRRQRKHALETGPAFEMFGETSHPMAPEVPRIKAAERIDFMVGRVGIELKVDGGNAEVLRQLDRYAASPDVDALVLITSRRRLVAGLPAELRGKPLVGIHVGAF
jgi:hypothetical protein